MLLTQFKKIAIEMDLNFILLSPFLSKPSILSYFLLIFFLSSNFRAKYYVTTKMSSIYKINYSICI